MGSRPDIHDCPPVKGPGLRERQVQPHPPPLLMTKPQRATSPDGDCGVATQDRRTDRARVPSPPTAATDRGALTCSPTVATARSTTPTSTCPNFNPPCTTSVPRSRRPSDRFRNRRDGATRQKTRLGCVGALVLGRVPLVQRKRIAVRIEADRLPADAGIEGLADELHALGFEPLARDGHIVDL
jgi:hypothetical protein